jgi:hypothetical protein
MTQQPIFAALTDVDAFEIGGWRPPLEGAPPVENWVAREGDGVEAFVLIGRRDGRLWQAPLLCLEAGTGVARVWAEWVRLGAPAPAAKVPLGKHVAAAGRDWLAAKLREAAA